MTCPVLLVINTALSLTTDGFWIDTDFEENTILSSILKEGGGYENMFEADDLVLFNVQAGFYSPAVLESVIGPHFRVAFLTKEGLQDTWEGEAAPLRIVTDEVYNHVISELTMYGRTQISFGRMSHMQPVLRTWLCPRDRKYLRDQEKKQRMTVNWVFKSLWCERRKGARDEAKKRFRFDLEKAEHLLNFEPDDP